MVSVRSPTGVLIVKGYKIKNEVVKFMEFNVSGRTYRFASFDEYDKDFNEFCPGKSSLDFLIERLDNGFDYLYREGDSFYMKMPLEAGFVSVYMLISVERGEYNNRIITYNGVETFDA